MIPTPSLLIYALNLPTSYFSHRTVHARRLAMAKTLLHIQLLQVGQSSTEYSKLVLFILL